MLLAVLLVFGFISASYAVSPSNGGYAGLFEYPTAQMPGDGKGWAGISWYEPYRPYYVTLGYFPWMEFNLRLTRFATGGIVSEGYGRYKDKAIDLKFLMLEQDETHPSVAFGVTDILGTEIMQAWYSVATWEWENLAITWGYGTDRLNGFFGGISWEPYDWLELKAEYSPL
nr:YjbH domain-containing protein [Synergistales bacterium]